MKPMIIMPTRRASLVAHFFAVLVMTGLTTASFATDSGPSPLTAPAGGGWQLLSGASPAPSASLATGQPHAVPPSAPAPDVATAASPSYAVSPVVLPGASVAAPGGILTLAITPQDINLRNALDRWLQQRGWQLAWKIDDDLPLEFNATFTGDFDFVLTQVMRATKLGNQRLPLRPAGDLAVAREQAFKTAVFATGIVTARHRLGVETELRAQQLEIVLRHDVFSGHLAVRTQRRNQLLVADGVDEPLGREFVDRQLEAATGHPHHRRNDVARVQREAHRMTGQRQLRDQTHHHAVAHFRNGHVIGVHTHQRTDHFGVFAVRFIIRFIGTANDRNFG